MNNGNGGPFRRWMAAVVAVGCVGTSAWIGCDSQGTPIFVQGVDVTASLVPELRIIRPVANVSISQGQGLLIEWRDADRDSAALISFSLVSVDDPNLVIPLVAGLQEDNDGVGGDRFTASTSFVPLGTYTLRGTIDDSLNRPVNAVAFNQAAGLGEVIIQIVEQGTTSIVNRPPQVFVRDPAFNLSVSQDDTLAITIQPTSVDPNPNQQVQDNPDPPFDPDSTATLYVLLDLDDDPLNDNVIAPDPSQIILLDTPLDINAGDNMPVTVFVNVDLEQIPIRDDGAPYHIRATITDGLNQPVHAYANGTINVVRAAAPSTTGIIDLGKIGRTLSGVVFRGFNPGSRLGTRMVNIGDFDQDGIDDFVLVARFGNPRNFGNIGEAYLIYGQDNVRFGGEINVNSTARTISGVIFEAPPTRCPSAECSVQTPGGIPIKAYENPRTDGITDVAFIPDLDGDNRPELLFGVSHVDGVYQARDDDPDDNPPTGDETVAVSIALSQGSDGLAITVEQQTEPVQGYFGVQDTYIDSGNPTQNFRGEDLQWVNGGPNNVQFALIKFTGVMATFPAGDTSDVIADIGGTITLSALNPGGAATVHELRTDFDASTVTFNTFRSDGQAPVAGVDYVMEELDTINADQVGDDLTINVDELLARLPINDLPGGEIRLIIVPDDAAQAGADDNVRVASSEFVDTRQRPRLDLNYDRAVPGGPLGCYADLLPNNLSDVNTIQDDGDNEDKSEALGFVSYFSSRNRDNSFLRNPNRLADTIVSLELVGQRNRIGSLDGKITALCEDDEAGHIAGARFQAGWYDFQDHLLVNQPPLNGLFGKSVASIGDLNLDGQPEIIVSAPQNELDLFNTITDFGPTATQVMGRVYRGSIIVFPGIDYDGSETWRDRSGDTGSAVIPVPLDQTPVRACGLPGRCDPRTPIPRCGPDGPSNTFQVFAENMNDFLGAARSAGDFNLDAVPDLMCGAPLNDRSASLADTGTMYIIYLRSPVGDIRLATADDPLTRPPMLRIRGETPGDRIGWKQEPVLDVNGDRIDDVMFSSPSADFIVPAGDCAAPAIAIGLDSSQFNGCRTDNRNDEVFLDDFCKAYDFNNDRLIDDEDRAVFDCLDEGGGNACCPVDNGYIGIIFGGVDRQGDRTISQLGTAELSGVIFYGTNPGDRAGSDISSAGDFDKDGFGDILITAPGERRIDANGRERMGVTYLIYGGPHLQEQEAPIELSEIGGRIPGIVFLTPYVANSPDEAPTEHVGLLGDINNDGFTDIGIGVPRADLLDDEFPQGNGTPNETGRRPDQGDIYVIYGNNINR